MRNFLRQLLLAVSLLSFGLLTLIPSPAAAQAKTSFKVGYVVYVGFMPLAWMRDSGTLKTWADKYGIEIEVIQVNDYIGMINQFIAGDLDAVAVAGMDALTMPAAGGVDTSVFVLFDYSNGNDQLFSRTATSVDGLLDQNVYLLQYSVSHYLLSRALAKAGITEPWRVKTTNISDTEIAAAYITQPDMEHVASWNPMATEMVNSVAGTTVLFDSAAIPGEIMDVMIARTDTLAANPTLGKALTGALYDAFAVWGAGGEPATQMVAHMASAMGTDVPGFEAQVAQTSFFTTPKAAADFLSASTTGDIWDLVRTFSFEQGLFGQGAASVDAIGIEVAPDRILGDPANVKLRLNPTFAAEAAAGTL